MQLIITSLCVISILFIIFSIYLLFENRSLSNNVKFLHDQCEFGLDLINRTILSDDIIESSINTVCEAYGIEEGDLRDYISRRQNENSTVTHNK